jgi:fructokinase
MRCVTMNNKNNSKKPRILGVGEVLWDLLPTGRQFGGAPANFAYHASLLGGAAYVVSAVGNDPLGREILDRLDALKINREHVAVDPEHPTGTVSVELDAHGKPTYTIHEGVAWNNIPSTPAMLELAQQADAVCFGSLAQRSACSRTSIQSLLAATTSRCLCVFDINLRQHYYSKEIIAEGLAASDVLKLNDEELPVVAALLGLQGTQDSLLSGLIQRYRLRLIALTKGSCGSVLQGPDERSVHPGVPATIVDTVGAGDSFTAAVTLGLLAGRSLPQINEHANQLASYVCSQAGATPSVPESLLLTY